MLVALTIETGDTDAAGPQAILMRKIGVGGSTDHDICLGFAGMVLLLLSDGTLMDTGHSHRQQSIGDFCS